MSLFAFVASRDYFVFQGCHFPSSRSYSVEGHGDEKFKLLYGIRSADVRSGNRHVNIVKNYGDLFPLTDKRKK
jgi:hypothetical protein